MRDWLTDIKLNRERFPVLKLPPLDEDQLAARLREGGVKLSEKCATMIIMHNDHAVLLEIQWEIASHYTASDLIKHAALLLSRLNTHPPNRIRLIVDTSDSFGISVIE